MPFFLSDMRFRRTLEDILFPAGKEFVNTRSLAYLKLVLADKRKSVLIASFPNSGYAWAGSILEYCILKKAGLTYETGYKDGDGPLIMRRKKNFVLLTPADSRSQNIRKIREVFSGVDIDYCLHTHGAWKYSPLWGLDSARTLLIIRNIPVTLFSFFMKKKQIRAYENGFRSFLEEGSLREIIGYYNSWGDFLQKKGIRCRIFKYEDMKKDTLAQFADMYEYVFGKKIEDDILADGIDIFSFDRQKQIESNMEKNESLHSLFRGAIDYSNSIEPEAMNLILSEIRKNLKHDFGYSY